MVLVELLETVLEWIFAWIGLHGLKAGAIAVAIVVLWHGHSALSFIHSATASLRIGFVGAGLVGVLLLVALAMGWFSVGDLPSIDRLLSLLPLQGVML